MATDTDGPKIPALIPDPKAIRSTGGSVRLGREVSLTMRGVPSPQRETFGEILASAGVRVSADAPFAVSARVEAGLDLAGAPEGARDEYYELTLSGDGAAIRSAGPAGILWGAHTLAGLYRAAALGTEVPELEIRDWPDLGNRGVFVEDKWGPDRMSLEDWKGTIDRLAAVKMNRMGVGLYGCWGNCRYEDRPTEFLMVSVPGYPQLRSEKNLRWYSPKDGVWRRETYLPKIFEEDFLGEVAAYGRKRGVTVIPTVNSLGHNTLIPRLVPEISARAEDGTPLGIGYCLSTPKTRAFIEAFYGSVVERYFPDGADFFHIQLDEVWPDFTDPKDPTRRADPWCRCPECRARDREENLQNYIVWLVKMLTEKGVKKVVMWNDQLTRHMDALDDSFAGKLRDAGLMDRLILHWWWYNNEALNDRTRVSIGRQIGLPGWVAPMTCYYNWERYSPTLRNIELMMRMGHDEGGEGAVSYAVHDPGWADHEMLLASYAWHFDAVGAHEGQLETFAEARFGGDAGRYLAASEALRKAASSPAVGRCHYYTYSYIRPEKPFPRSYPGEALDALAGMEGDAAGQLREAASAAREAAEGFEALARDVGRDADVLACVRSMSGEAARIAGEATAFAYFLSVREATSGAGVDEALIAGCEAARAALLDAMGAMEEKMPGWVAPASLMALSVLLAFFDQLRGDLAEVIDGSRKPGGIRWDGAWRV